MATDDERREVARRLREYVDLPDDWWQETCAEFYVEKCVFGNVDRHSEEELFTRLADLIDPGEPEARCVAEVKVDGEQLSKSVEIRPVDRDALLALADEIEDSDVTYCVSTQYVLDSYASRIREALGVES